MLLVAVAALLALPLQAQAQTTLVSNTGQGVDSRAGSTGDRAQRFTTGANSGGYTLSSVEFTSDDLQGDDAAVSVCTVDADGYPTSTCTALTAPSSFAAGTIVFTGTMTLAANTTYTLLLMSPGGETLSMGSTSADGEDSGGATGWSIADAYDVKNASAVWGTTTDGQSFRITVKGTVVATDTTAPSPDSAEVPTTGDRIAVNFDEGLDLPGEFLPAAVVAAFTVTADGVDLDIQTVSGIALDWLAINLPTGTTIYQNQTVTLSYDKTVAGADALEDAAEDEVASFTNFAVTNSSTVVNNAPVFSAATATRSVAENTAAGENVGAVLTATDDDNDTLAYSLEGPDAASFDIVSSSGQIRTKSGVTYDHETKSSYSVAVKADDN